MLKQVILVFCLISIFIHSFGQIQTSPEKRHIKIVSHRGASKFAPENTIAAFLKAAEMGADYCEMDIRQTKDGHFIIMHDKTVDRTTNGHGEVSQMTLDNIKKLDAGSSFGKEYAGEPIPTLREVLKAIKGKILPDLDFKEGDPEALVKLLEEEGYLADSNVTFYGGWKNCETVKKLSNKILIRPGSKDGANGFQKLMDKLNPPIVNINRGGFTEYYINLIHQKGKLAFVNALRKTDNKKFIKRAIAAGPDFLQANKLDILIPLVREHNSQVSQ